MDSSRDVVGAYESLQEANMQVANVFLFDGYFDSSDDPTYEFGANGSLVIRCNTNGSTGGCVEIFVESAPATRAPGPRR
jgi:hypothetical protein